jgi:transposase
VCRLAWLHHGASERTDSEEVEDLRRLSTDSHRLICPPPGQRTVPKRSAWGTPVPTHQLRLEALFPLLRDTLTAAAPCSNSQSRVSPASKPSTAEIASGTVVRSDRDVLTDRTAFDSKVRPIVQTRLDYDDPGHIIDPHIGLHIAEMLKNRQYIVLHKGRRNPRSMTDTRARWEKALQMAVEDPGGVRKVSDGFWLVRAARASGFYKVRYEKGGWSCDCPDFDQWNEPCKHVFRVYKDWFPESKLGPAPGETNEEPEQFAQDWASYDAAQQEEFRLQHVLLRALVDTAPDREREPHSPGRPSIRLSDQLFVAVQKVGSQLSCRRSHGLIEISRQRGQVSKIPHFGISSIVLRRQDVTPILQQMIEISALPLRGLESQFAVDSTGFRTTSFGDYNQETHGPSRRNVWLKAHAIVGTRTHVVVKVKVTDGNVADSPQFPELLKGAVLAGFEVKEVSADKGYLSRDNVDAAAELGVSPYIPFKKNSTGRARGSALYNKLFHYFQLHKEEFDAHYHRRSNVESVFGAIKKKFGETLKSKDRVAQENELLAKIVAYNLTVLVHEMFEHEVVPDFLMPHRPEGVAPTVVLSINPPDEGVVCSEIPPHREE